MKKKAKTKSTSANAKKENLPKRKNTNESTRTAGRQRSGNNEPQQGSH